MSTHTEREKNHLKYKEKLFNPLFRQSAHTYTLESRHTERKCFSACLKSISKNVLAFYSFFFLPSAFEMITKALAVVISINCQKKQFCLRYSDGFAWIECMHEGKNIKFPTFAHIKYRVKYKIIDETEYGSVSE